MYLDIKKKLFKYDTHSLKFNTIRSAFWSIVGKGSENVIRIAGNLILTRILFPEAFGMMAIANVVVTVVALFADMGVSISVIQNPRGAEKEFLDTSWIVSIFRGIILWLVISAIALPASLFYKEPQLTWILLIMALSPLLNGFLNPALPLLVKKFQVEKQVVMNITTQVIGLIVTIVLSITIRSVYALAIGQVVSYILKLVASYMVIKYRPSFKWNKTAGRELIRFGKQIILNTMITVLFEQMGVLMMGKLMGMEDVSFYNIGSNFGGLLIAFVSQMLLQSYFAAVSSVQSDIQRVQKMYRRTITLLIAIMVPLSMSLSLFAQDIIRLLYDPRYQLSYISMYWIGLAGIFRTIAAVAGINFIATGRPAMETITKFCGLVLLVILLPFSIRYGGLNGGSACLASVFVFVSIAGSILLKFKLNFSIKIILNTWLQAVITSCFCYIVYFLLRPYLNSEDLYNIPFAVISGVIFIAISAIAYRILEGKKSITR
ncbi:MAG: oligosaccharide flippase family protein [Spirochaetota bacterium]